MDKQTLDSQMKWHLKDLAAENLRDMARNPSADRAWRKGAVQLLLEKGYTRYANHPDIELLRMEVEAEARAKQDVMDVVETSIEAEIPHASDPEPMRASFTTQSMFQEEVVRNPEALGDDALADDFPQQDEEADAI